MQARRALLFVALCASSACRSAAIAPAVTPGPSPEFIQARLDEADALTERGCYLCLRDAAEIFTQLMTFPGARLDVYRKALDNDLMIATREIELRLPDSGARERANHLRQDFDDSYDPLFGALEFLATSPERLPDGRDFVFGPGRQWREDVLRALEPLWSSNVAAAYLYLAVGRGSSYFVDRKIDPERIAEAHPEDISLKYALLAMYPQPFTGNLLDKLLADEPRFAEIYFVRGQRSLTGGGLAGARRNLMAAREILPASLSVLSLLAPVEFSYARYGAALAIYEEILARGPDSLAHLGKAEALSYLKRHQLAIVELDELLNDPSRQPGDKYYWRGWNKLQLGDLQPAYEDATAALRFMRGADAFRLAGIAAFGLSRLPEARGYFESALRMKADDCDSLQYIGQLDGVEKNWPEATAGFKKAAACFEQSIVRMSADLEKKKTENTGGLLDEQIAAVESDLQSRRLLLEQSVRNVEIASRNSLSREKASR